jgi:flagellin
MTRLASGKKIIAPYDDPGSLSVSMKLEASINRLGGAQNNIRNGISFLEVQDGLLAFAGRILDRMSELKGLSSQDPMKSSLDQASYNDEFKDLQVQLFEMSKQTFNGVSLFANFATDNSTGLVTANQVQFRSTDNSLDNTLTIFTSPDGNDGSKVSLSKSALLSAITINTGNLNASLFNSADNSQAVGASGRFTFASERVEDTMDLNQISVGVFAKALENIASLRAENGGTMSRLSYSDEMISQMKSNMKAALGRIVDVDIAEESTNMAKYNVLTQASAAMLAQANSTTDIALMLLR